MKIILLISIIFLPLFTLAQVAIGTTDPHESAIFELRSSTKGFLPPRLNNKQLKAINNPEEGLMAICFDCCYDNSTLFFNNGTDWISADQGCEACEETIDVFNVTDLTEMAFVIGQSNFNSGNAPSSINASNFRNPYGVAIDESSGKVFVSDLSRRRVLRFATIGGFLNGENAEFVLGQDDFVTGVGGNANDKLTGPRGLLVDSEGDLWICDTGNNRIVKHNNASGIGVNGRNADLIFDTGVDNPYQVDEDEYGTLWVASENQILGYYNVKDITTNNPTPDVILGTTAGISASQFEGIKGLTIIGDNLYIADGSNHRILRFNDVQSISTGDAADEVYFQSAFGNNVAPNPPTNGSLNAPHLLSSDANGGIYITDGNNNRILYVSNINEKDSTAVAEHVFGQPGFTTSSPGTSNVLMDAPRALQFMEFNGQKYITIADRKNNRIAVYTADKISIDENVNGVPTAGLSGVSLKSGGSVTYEIVTQPSVGNILTITDANTGALNIDASGISVANDEAHSFVYKITNEGGCSREVEGVFFIINI